VVMHETVGQPDLVRLSPEGGFAAAFSTNGVQWYATATGQEQPKLEREGMRYFQDAGWLSEQRLVALVTAKARRLEPGSEEWIVLWDTSTGKVVQTTVSRGVPEVLAVAPGGQRFAEGGLDKRVRVRDATTLAILQEFRAHDGAITALAWHPSRPILATASMDLCIRLWDLDTGRRLEELRGATQPPHQLSFSPSGHLLGAASPDDDARIWEPQSLRDKTKPAAGDWEDLLAPLTPATVAQTGGGWRMDNGVLYSPNKKRALLPLSDNLRDTSYQLRVKLRQLESKNFFYLALPVAGRTVGFAFEVAPEDGCLTGFSQIDGKSLKDLPYAVRGKLVKDAEQHDLEVTVRLNGDNVTLSATLDDKPLCEWSGHAAALNQHPDWNTPQGTLMLSTQTSDWVVHDAKLKRL
ncbi:MAG TPA: WD40 repeat domain-containing protein, partial [Prosthecobacter sp.]